VLRRKPGHSRCNGRQGEVHEQGGTACGAPRPRPRGPRGPRRKAEAITLNGTSQFNDDHAFTKAMAWFEERVNTLYGKPINFVLHKNSFLGLEKLHFESMTQGRAVDYSIVSPAHMSTFSRTGPFIDAPSWSATSRAGTACLTPTCSSRWPMRWRRARC
jgi:hypothetical protein